MLQFKTFTLATLLAFHSATSLAVPEVEAVPISGGCSAYPGYDASTGVAGPWLIEIVDSSNPAIEGFTDTSNEVKNSDGTTRFGYITFPTNNQLAKNPIRCSPSSAPSLETITSDGFTMLQISPYPYDATMVYPGPGVDISGTPVLPFSHYDSSGNKIDGVFLGGYDNTTTWGVTYNPKGSGSYGQDFFYIRLLGPEAGSPSDGEFTAFIKVYDS